MVEGDVDASITGTDTEGYRIMPVESRLVVVGESYYVPV